MFENVSVIIPCRGRSAELIRCIDSIIMAGSAVQEIIIVDDFSSEPLSRVIDQAYDRRITHLRSEQHIGASAARNMGIQRATSDFVAFCDSDDVWLPGRLEKALSLLAEHENVVAVCSTYLLIEGDEVAWHPPGRARALSYIDRRLISRRNIVGTPTLTVRRSSLTKISGFDESLPRFQDWDLAMRLCTLGEIAMLSEPLVLRAISPDSLSLNRDAYFDAILKLFAKHEHYFCKHSDLEAIWRFRKGYANYVGGRKIAAIREFSKALIRNPIAPATLFRSG